MSRKLVSINKQNLRNYLDTDAQETPVLSVIEDAFGSLLDWGGFAMMPPAGQVITRNECLEVLQGFQGLVAGYDVPTQLAGHLKWERRLHPYQGGSLR